MIKAHPDFQLVISYNPGYQSLMKDLKQSTKQRFVGLDFDYAPATLEADIIAQETGADKETAVRWTTPSMPFLPEPQMLRHIHSKKCLCRKAGTIDAICLNHKSLQNQFHDNIRV